MTGRRAKLVGRAVGVVRPVLIDKVERDHRQSDAAFLRRRIVVAATLAVGATLLGLSFSTRAGRSVVLPADLRAGRDLGDRQFRVRTAASGSHQPAGSARRPIFTPILVGLILAAIFAVGGLIIRTIPALASLTEDVIGYARANNLTLVFVILVVNGIAEELFFRGALFAASAYAIRC